MNCDDFRFFFVIIGGVYLLNWVVYLIMDGKFKIVQGDVKGIVYEDGIVCGGENNSEILSNVIEMQV